jgi:hypothetical protein
MNTGSVAGTRPDIVFQCPYGGFRSNYVWAFNIVGFIGLIAVPIGIFANTGWTAGGHPLEPWTATLIIEIFAAAAISVAVFAQLASWRHRQSPRRIAVTRSAILVPQGLFWTNELELPFAEIKVTVFDVGIVKQLQIMHGRKKILLTSARFVSDADFDALVNHLPE